VHDLAQNVRDYIRRQKLLKPGDRVGVALSGGVDSVALLCLLLELRKELGIVLTVVHFNHKLRGAESDADEKFVASLAREHKLRFHSSSTDVAAHAAREHMSVETAARELRYKFFRELLRSGTAGKISPDKANASLDKVATGHTLDDQAETVLMRLVRGAGTRGLAGIYPKLSVPTGLSEESAQHSALSKKAPGSRRKGDSSRSPEEKQAGGAGATEPAIIRPLLAQKRKDLETYLASVGQGWRNDSSNRDLRFTRNRVRHGILPRLERYLNPAVREALAETAEIARAEEEYLEHEVERLIRAAWIPVTSAERRQRDIGANKASGGALKLELLRQLPIALQRRLVRSAGELLGLQLEFRPVEEILRIAAGGPRSASLPNGWSVVRGKQELRFELTVGAGNDNPEYEYSLSVPGRVKVPETATIFEAEAVRMGNSSAGYNPDHLLDTSATAKELRVRNWRPGDRFWPAHTKSPKKIKELLQELHLARPERKRWPVVVSSDEIVWLRGFPTPLKLRPKADADQAVVIREVRLADVMT